MNRKRCYLAVWVILSAVLGILIGRSTVESTERHPPPTPDARLTRPLPPLDFNETPFGETLAELSRQSGARFSVTWRAVEAAGIDESIRVTRRTSSAPLKDVLEDLLAQVGGGTVRLAYRTRDDGVIQISTADDLDLYVVRVYDLRDLLEKDRANAEVKLRKLRNDSNSSPVWSDDVFIDCLTRVIQDGIEPDLWRYVGGSVGYIYEFSGHLVIVHNEQVHERIAALLRGLRNPERP